MTFVDRLVAALMIGRAPNSVTYGTRATATVRFAREPPIGQWHVVNKPGVRVRDLDLVAECRAFRDERDTQVRRTGRR